MGPGGRSWGQQHIQGIGYIKAKEQQRKLRELKQKEKLRKKIEKNNRTFSQNQVGDDFLTVSKIPYYSAPKVADTPIIQPELRSEAKDSKFPAFIKFCSFIAAVLGFIFMLNQTSRIEVAIVGAVSGFIGVYLIWFLGKLFLKLFIFAFKISIRLFIAVAIIIVTVFIIGWIADRFEFGRISDILESIPYFVTKFFSHVLS